MSEDALWLELEQATARDVERALDREQLDERDLVALLSNAALPYLEAMAQKAQRVTRQRFGRTMQLYAPLYLSNECVSRCSYCGFSHDVDMPRRTLDVDATKSEAEHLHAQGFRHLLLVSGEAPRTVNLEYLETITRELRSRFDSIALEVAAFDLPGYQRLVAAGVDGLTLYQETYQSEVYRSVHLSGPKRNYARRLLAMNWAGQSGFRSLGIGALLGLAPWQLEAVALARHGRALTKEFWRSRVAVSFPRIRENAGGRLATHPVSDRELVQLICAMRLVLPDAELVLSTREPARLRDQLMNLGITRMSAGSRTNPGGYGDREHSLEQFSIEDERSPHEVARVLLERGFEPVWKDFDRGFLQSMPVGLGES
jgi:2-iminoacetate synthase